MKDILILVGIVALAGSLMWIAYDPEVSREYGKPFQETREQGCNRSGFCMACGLSYDGKMDCNPRMRPNCPGKRSVLVEARPFISTRESGKLRTGEDVKVLEVLGACH